MTSYCFVVSHHIDRNYLSANSRHLYKQHKHTKLAKNNCPRSKGNIDSQAYKSTSTQQIRSLEAFSTRSLRRMSSSKGMILPNLCGSIDVFVVFTNIIPL